MYPRSVSLSFQSLVLPERKMASRPELTGPPDLFYDAKEARKYTSSSRIINVQAEIADRCIELLNIPAGEKRLILDIGCGSGLSGAVIEEAGHAWIGCDISSDMLRIASERAQVTKDSEDSGEEDSDSGEKDQASSDDDDDDESMDKPRSKRSRVVTSTRTAELVQHDMGLGLPFRDGSFDAAVSVSALQWLCYDNASDQSAPKRLARFFGSLYRCLKRNSRAALQFYPENDAQAALVASAAARAGFAGGIVVDFPNSSKARKHYLCLSMERTYNKPSPKLDNDKNTGTVVQSAERSHNNAPQNSKSKRKNDRDWVLAKKDFQRRQGRIEVRPDTKFSGRKRKDRF